MLVVGVDASNLRAGGGVTHLIELLSIGDPSAHGIDRIIVWSSEATLRLLPDRPWLVKRLFETRFGGLPGRLIWQRRYLSKALKAEQCSILFAPGGNYVGGFTPMVTMSRNLLPFEWSELKRYGASWTALRLVLLRYFQISSFRKADGIIFLNKHAESVVQKVMGTISAEKAIIPHGLNSRFSFLPKKQRVISTYSDDCPYRLVYVSIVDLYKHQWHLVEAVGLLRAEGFSIALDLVGPANPVALRRLNAVIRQLGADDKWVKYHGEIPYASLHEVYGRADMGVFASSCENMPNILLETMAAGLPIVCSNRGPMPDILGRAGQYFNPEDPKDIARAIRTVISSVEMRSQMVELSTSVAKKYSWERCMHETFAFLSSVFIKSSRTCRKKS